MSNIPTSPRSTPPPDALARTPSPIATYERLGGRHLGIPDAIAQSVGFLGPVFSMAFLVPLVVGLVNATHKGGGIASPISVLIATVGMVAIGWLVAKYARQVHAAGGLYDYVSRGLGERAGVATGILYYAGVLLLSVGLIVLIGGYVHDTVLGEFNKTPLPQWAWSAILIVVLVSVLYTGVRISTRAQLVLALVSFLVVLGVFVMIIVKLGHANSSAPFKPSSAAQGWNGIFFGVLYGVLLFVGFETAANLGEESKEPKRAIPIAVFFSLGIAAAFFVLGTYAQLAGYHFNLKVMGLPQNVAGPLFALAGPRPGYGSVSIRRLVELVVLFDMLAVALGTGVSSTRGIFALARDRRLPPVLARTSRRRGTPLAAILVLGVLATINVLLTQNWNGLFAVPPNPHYFAVFSWDSTFGGFALVVVYLLLCCGAVWSFRRSPGIVLTVLSALVGVAIMGGAIYASFKGVPSPTIWAPWSALGVFVVGILVAFLTKGRTPAAMHLPDLAVNPELARIEPPQVAPGPVGGLIAGRPPQ